ncbi:glycosyltransferase family 20-domain-containing protein, partial [Pavlovales sp. CCMP2436]
MAELSKQLRAERTRRSALQLGRIALTDRSPRIVIVANRLPFSISASATKPPIASSAALPASPPVASEISPSTPNGAAAAERASDTPPAFTGAVSDLPPELVASAGGLVSALTGVKRLRMLWVGWPGGEEPVDPVLTAMVDNAALDEAQWNAYVAVNRAFADATLKVLRPGDIVWVHDFHLMLLPAMLRERAPPGTKIGWFLHTPFPASEVFRTLPMREQLLHGLLGADVLGFQTPDNCRNFLSTCTRTLGLAAKLSSDTRRLLYTLDTPEPAAEPASMVATEPAAKFTAITSAESAAEPTPTEQARELRPKFAPEHAIKPVTHAPGVDTTGMSDPETAHAPAMSDMSDMLDVSDMSDVSDPAAVVSDWASSTDLTSMTTLGVISLSAVTDSVETDPTADRLSVETDSTAPATASSTSAPAPRAELPVDISAPSPRSVVVDAFPIGIDPARFEAAVDSQ